MQKLFHQFGLSDKEIKTFLTLLKLEMQPVSVLSKHLGLPRPTTYLQLENLREKGLIQETQQFGVKYVRCIPVEELSTLLDLQQEKITHSRQVLSQELPKLQALQSQLSITPKTQIYEGMDQILQMYEKISQAKEIRGVFNPHVAKEFVPIYYEKFPKLVEENGATLLELAVDTLEARAYQKRFSRPKHQIRLLPPGITFESDNVITPDAIYLISNNHQDIAALEIFSDPIRKTFEALFEGFWGRTES